MRLFWEELLGSSARYVRGAILVSTDGQVLKSTLSEADELELDTRWTWTTVASARRQVETKTDKGWILAAPLNKHQILAVVIHCGPHIRFNLDLTKLFAHDSPSNGASRLPDPIIMPQPPKRGGANAVPEYEDY
jgi:hypothetical protein